MGRSEESKASTKIQKVLNLRLENNKDVIDGLKELSKFYTENTPERRRQFKSCVEKQALDLSETFAKSLKVVHDTLDGIYKDVHGMNSTVCEMTEKLSAARTNTRNLIRETKHFQRQIEDVEKKQDISSAIINQFQLKPSEVSSIGASNLNIDMFKALKRSDDIYKKCKILDEAGCQTLAQDIRNQMLQYQETGIERLFRWAQSRCRTIDQPDPTGLLPHTMSTLLSRPQLFNQIIDEYCANRRDLLVRQLISALTSGGRPIEHRVTEPKRYVGDMLAWLHQALPPEKDSLAYLLRACDTSDTTDKVQLALCSITEGVCHPLKVRIEHILLGENNVRDPLLVLALLGLLRYYHRIINQVVGGGKLESTLLELMDTAERTLMISITSRVSVLLGSQLDKSHTNLRLSTGAEKVLGLLGQMMSADISTPEPLVQKITSCILDPLLMTVTESAARLSAVDGAVYLLNAYHSIQQSLAIHPFMDDRLERLKAQSDAQVDTLTSEQASCLVAHLGLGVVYRALQGPLPKPLSRLATFDAAHISSISGKLGKVVRNTDVYMLAQLSLLDNVTQRKEIVCSAGTVICSVYSQLYQLVHDPDNLYETPQAILPLNPDIVRQAFNILF